MIVELSIGLIVIGSVFYAFWRLRTRKAKLAVRAGEKDEKTEELSPILSAVFMVIAVLMLVYIIRRMPRRRMAGQKATALLPSIFFDCRFI